jgi:cullin-associated NEDD8-dissociated protein 1
LALSKESLLQVDVSEGSHPQPPCGKFGLNSNLEYMQEAFNDKDALIMNNIGVMVEPMTIDDYLNRRKRQPLGNFGHGGMARGVQSVSANDKDAKGVLGRMIRKLSEGAAPLKSDLYSIKGATKILEGAMTPNIIQAGDGMTRYRGYSAMKDQLNALNENKSSSIFAETFSSMLESSLSTTEVLGELLDATSLSAPDTFGNGRSLGGQLREVSKLIKMDITDRQMERAGYVVVQNGYDTHNSFDKLDELLAHLDASLRSFSIEMKAQGLWDNVTIVLISDFGRTLSSNTLVNNKLLFYIVALVSVISYLHI